MMKSYSSPALYMQGQNILSQDYDQITCLGHRAIILSNGLQLMLQQNHYARH